MTILLWLAGSFAVLTLLDAWLSRRFGRGAYKDSYDDPLNEIQTTSPWKMWPF